MKENNLSISKSDSWKMFDEISPRYDFLNHFLSFGLDIHWRNKLKKFLPAGNNLKILDLATGTGDVLITLTHQNDRIQSAKGLDMADKMMEIGRDKIAKKGLNQKISLQHGDAHQIPFDANSFQCATIAFGIRNMQNPTQVLIEMNRVLTASGRVIVLEFSLPQNRLFRALHLFYLRTIVPFLGAIFSGNYEAYKYLNQTIENFPYGENFCALMKNAGFVSPKAYPLLWGVASIYTAEK